MSQQCYSSDCVYEARQFFIDGGAANAALFSYLTYSEIPDKLGLWVALSEVIEKLVETGQSFNIPERVRGYQRDYARLYYDGLLASLKELNYHGVFNQAE